MALKRLSGGDLLVFLSVMALARIKPRLAPVTCRTLRGVFFGEEAVRASRSGCIHKRVGRTGRAIHVFFFPAA